MMEIRNIRREVWGYALLVLMAFVAFGPALRAPFMWDDHVMIEGNSHIQSVSLTNLRHAFTHDVFLGAGDAYYRPLQTLSNMVDYKVWGESPLGFHLTNLLFHALNACLLLFLLKRFMPERQALLAALFFVVHPVIVEQLLIVAGRAEIMSFTFILLTVLFAWRKSVPGLLLSLGSFLAACLFKESGAVALPLLLLFGWTNPSFKVRKIHFVFYGGVFVVYWMLRGAVSTSLISSWQGFGLFLVRDVPTIIVSYVSLLLFPTDLHSHRRMVFYPMWMWVSPVFLGLVSTWLWRRRSCVLWMGAAWFLLGLFPKIPLLATNSLMLDHWGYLGSPGLFVVLAVLLTPVFPAKPGVKTLQRLGAGFFLFSWVFFSWWNSWHRNTDEKMYRWALKHPTSSQVRYNLGLVCYETGRLDEARSLFEASYQMNPQSPMTLNALALTLYRQGDKEGALRLLSFCAETFPNFLSTYYNRALLRRGALGLDDLNHALSLNPDYKKARELKIVLEAETKASSKRLVK